jgi:D-3-phosphoglycerate dehydrogenase / 2-oxoglutarate reductase
MPRILITTVPFAIEDRYPLDLLEKERISYIINPLGKKLNENELISILGECEVIVAGTESISKKVMAGARNLKMISRVGIGLDSVDLLEARRMGIAVSYTPDAPAPAVAELTLGLMYSLIRHVHKSNIQMHQGNWHRFFGKRLINCRIGVIGMGRIGCMVFKHLKALGCSEVLYNDIKQLKLDDSIPIEGVRFAEKEEIYRTSDIISIHVPLTTKTKNMITTKQIEMMKKGVVMINTARGGIINENDLFEALNSQKIAGAAIDVFETEPYTGDLAQHDNCILTAHMGSMSVDCRTRMEIEATEEAVRFLLHKELLGTVPEEEYETQRQDL